MNAVAVIAKREYVERLKSRGFIIGTILALSVPLLAFAAFTSPPTIGTPVIQPASPMARRHRDCLGERYRGSSGRDERVNRLHH